MPDFSTQYTPGFLENAATGGGVVTASASTNTKGVYAELITSTAYDADGIMVALQQNSTTAGGLMDFAIGAAGSEQIVMADVIIGQTARLTTYVFIPISLPAGSRVAARCQSTVSSQNHAVATHLYRAGLWGPPPGGTIVTLGADTSDSGGQVIDPGGTVDTYGSWAQLSASVGQDIAAVYLMLGNRQNSAPSGQSVNFYLQFGIGAAASEVVVWGPIRFASSSSGSYGPLPSAWFPVSIPAGSRLVARARAGTNDATDRLFDLVVYGLVI